MSTMFQAVYCNFLLVVFFRFHIAEAHLDVIFRRKWHFPWRHDYISYTQKEVYFKE